MIEIKLDQIWESNKVKAIIKILEQNKQGYKCLSLTNGQIEVFTKDELLKGFTLS